MKTAFSNLENEIQPLREQIIHHPVYAAITDLKRLNIFMEYHVFAVWDFMSLLKALQRELTCTTVPWFPVGDADTRYLINEIVTGEESDVDLLGIRKSHYELYLEAMEQSGADSSKMILLADLLKNGAELNNALAQATVPAEAQDFVRHTFSIINSGKPHIQSAAFTFGREDLIPDMFHRIVSDLSLRFPETISLFKYYLDRHIEVDGDHHGNLALQMTGKLCDDEAKWLSATKIAKEALSMRIHLWNGALDKIKQL